jgi:hypothetical protein
MVANVGFDTLLGSIPVIGDVFDAMWKSNTKNVAILERHVSKQTSQSTRGRGYSAGAVVLTVIALLLIIGFGLLLGIFAARLIWSWRTR